MTLVEVVISASVLAIIVSLCLGLMGTTSEHVADTTIQSDLRARGRNAALTIQRELRCVVVTTLATSRPHPSAGLDTRIRYQQVVGFDTTSGDRITDPTGTSTHEISFEAQEAENELDDDGDGLIDEGRLRLYRNGVAVAEIANGVDGHTVQFQLRDASGGAATAATAAYIHVQFTLQQRGRRAGVTETWTESFDVGLRNY